MAGRRFARQSCTAVAPQPGMRNIILATCARGQEARCTAELGQLIDNVLDNGDSDADEEGGITHGASFSELIAKEVSDLKDKGTRKHHALNVGELRCIVLVQSSKKYDAVSLVSRLFPTDNPFASRFCQRVIPLQLIIRADISEIRTSLPTLLCSAFSEPGQKYAVVFESRLNDTLHRSTVIEMIAEIVGQSHSVHLTSPDLVIMVQVFKNLCGLSVLDRYYSRARYNLQSYYANLSDGKASIAVVE